jgi:Glycosyl transferase family 2
MLVDPKISLLHATYHRSTGPLGVKEAWLDLADGPDHIEYILAMDDDDEATVARTEGHLWVIGPAIGTVTAVRNWNAAAKAARGDLIMVVADDLFPPAGWDTTLLGMIGRLDPTVVPFAVKVSDSPFTPDAPHEKDTKLHHPAISRAFYQRHGLFSDEYTGLFCDTDLTVRAFWESVILDGRSLVLDHQHPDVGQNPRVFRIAAERQLIA